MSAPDSISTVGGLIQAQLDRIAVAGDQVLWHDLRLEVLKMDGMRIDRVRVTKTSDAPGGD